jgi:hypothetical protein
LLKESCFENPLYIFRVGPLLRLLLREKIHIAGTLPSYEIGSDAFEGD